MNFKLSFERNFMPEKELLLAKSLCNAYTFRSSESELMDQQSRILNKMVLAYGFETFSTNIRIISASVTRKKISATVIKYETIKLPNNDLHILSQTTF